MYAQGLDFCVILCPVKLLFNINYPMSFSMMFCWLESL